MNTALNELRELERQSTAKHAPDVVLDTLETQRQSPGGGSTPGSSSESLSPIHSVMLRSAANADANMRRSASSSSSSGGDAVSTFKPAVAPRMGVQLKPPALRPKPMVLPKARDQGAGPQPPDASSPQDPLDKSCTM